MRYLLRAIFTGSSALGLAMVVGCGAASDHATSHDAAGEFRVPRSIASAEPRRLATDDRLAIDIAYTGDCSRVSAAELNVSPAAAREALPRSVFVVRPAEPLVTDCKPVPATPVAKLLLPPADRGLELPAPNAEAAPVPDDTVGVWTPSAAPATAEQGSPVLRIPPAPRNWGLEQRLADARSWVAPPPAQPAHAHRVPVIAAAPLVVPAPEQIAVVPPRAAPAAIPQVASVEPVATPAAPTTEIAPYDAEASPVDDSAMAPAVDPQSITVESAPIDAPLAALQAEPAGPSVEQEAAVPELAPAEPLVPSESNDEPEPIADQVPIEGEDEDAAPVNPILLTPETDGPDSHWPSTIVPLPPLEGVRELAPEAPLPSEAAAPVPAAPVEPPTAPPVSTPPARQLDSAPLARPIPGAAPRRTAEMDAVSRLAFTRVQGGFSLAQRGALFAARSEFIGAMRILAQAKDTEQHTNRHSQALAAGLRAIEEADSLLPSGSNLEADLDVQSAIAGHRTPVLHGVDTSNMTVTAALQQYYTYAQEQLALSGDGEPVASMALYGLGKIHAALARQPSTNVKSPEPKSMIFHQAALLIDGRNYLAANDLGVLLVRLGRLPDAREAFLHSLSQQPQANTWDNLSAVHRHLGETQLADEAHQRAVQISQQGKKPAPTGTEASDPNAVTWVDPSEFAGSTPQTAHRPVPETAERLKPIPESRETPVLERVLPWTANKNTNRRK